MRRTLTVSAGLLAGATALYLADVRFMVPHRFDDALRVMVLAQAAFGLGMIIAIVGSVTSLTFDERDKLINTLRWVSISYFLAGLYIAFDIISMIGNGYVTWRGPLAMTIFLIGDFGLTRLMRHMRHLTLLARQQGASSVTLGLMDTSKPGPNVPLT